MYLKLYHKAILSIFYGRRIPTEVCWRKKQKIKIKFQVSDFFSCRRHFKDFVCVCAGLEFTKTTDLGKNLLSSHHVEGKNKIKLKF